MDIKGLDDMLIGDDERVDPLSLVGRTLGSVTGRQLVAASVYDDRVVGNGELLPTGLHIEEEPIDGDSTFI